MTLAEPATSRLDLQATQVGSVFVSNYPPYSFWTADAVAVANDVLRRPPAADATLGLYLHIPFCRQRCKFCYFRVVTDKNSSDVRAYLDALASEVERYAELPAVAGRPLRFVYFGGGTPSYISAEELRKLSARVRAAIPWDGAEEVAFECEPGTLTRSKLEAIRDIGVTRLSLGVESFDDAILRENGRAHESAEIERVKPWIRELDFPQLNIDLIAGMVGETWETWRHSVARTLEYEPDSVTIYQMELPFNTVYSKGVLRGEGGVEFASWSQKREWHAYAIDQLEAAGYEIWSAYTMLKTESPAAPPVHLRRRGVARQRHGGRRGVRVLAHRRRPLPERRPLGRLPGPSGGPELPISRAFVTTPDERLTRELVLQMKTGRIDRAYFQGKFGVDVVERFAEPLRKLESQELLEIGEGEIRLTRGGLLRVDQLLPEFYAPDYRDSRYT